MDLKDLSYRISVLSVFRGLLNKKEITAFLGFLKSESLYEKLSFYGEFVSSLGECGGSFSAFLKKAVCEDENIYITSVAKNMNVSSSIKENAEKELAKEVRQAKKDGLIDQFIYGSISATYLADIVDSL